MEKSIIFDNLQHWDNNVSFFIRFSILTNTVDVNLNRLKNIFCSIIEDLRVWREVSLMFDNNVLSFDYNRLYFNYLGNISNSLSLILFEMYMSDFDFYIFNLSRYFYYKYFFYKDLFYHRFLNRSSTSLVPLIVKKFNILSNPTLVSFKQSFFYNKNLTYLRYLGYFFFGIIGSISFTKKLGRKFIAFVKGNLLFDFYDFVIFSSFDKNIAFGGFRISFFSNSFSYIDKKKFLHNSVFLRLKKFRLSLLKSFSTRFYFEFLFRLENLNFDKIGKFILLKDNKIWLFFLFSESLRLFNIENFSFYSKDLNLPFKTSFGVYYFNYFLFGVRKIITSLENKNFSSSSLPVDLAFNLVLSEFKTNCLIINNDLLDLLDFRVKFSRSYFVNKKSFFSGILFSTLDFMNFFYSYLRKDFFTCKVKIKLSIPLNIIIYRLRLMGIFHFFKNRPIGSSVLMFEEDYKIFHFFRMLFFSFLLWYRICLTFSYPQIYFIYKLLFQSCLLSISRKHNKSLAWSYSLYRHVFVFNNFEQDLLFSINDFEFFNERFFLSF